MFVFYLQGNSKRADIIGLAQATELGAEEEGPQIQDGRGGERKGGERKSDPSSGDRPRDLRSEISGLRQLLEEKELLDIANRQHSNSPASLDSTLGRIRSLFRTAPHLVDERDVEEKKKDDGEEADKEESPRLNNTDTDGRYSVRDTLTMLGKIVSMNVPFE